MTQSRRRTGPLIIPRSRPRLSNSVEGETTSPCPVCHRPRSRVYLMKGPYSLDQIKALVEERLNRKPSEYLIQMEPRISDKRFFKFPVMCWLVSPDAKGRCDKYYLIDVSAKCDNERCARCSGEPKPVPEHSGYRRFGRTGIAWNRFKAFLRWEVKILPPT